MWLHVEVSNNKLGSERVWNIGSHINKRLLGVISL